MIHSPVFVCAQCLHLRRKSCLYFYQISIFVPPPKYWQCCSLPTIGWLPNCNSIIIRPLVNMHLSISIRPLVNMVTVEVHSGKQCKSSVLLENESFGIFSHLTSLRIFNQCTRSSLWSSQTFFNVCSQPFVERLFSYWGNQIEPDINWSNLRRVDQSTKCIYPPILLHNLLHGHGTNMFNETY